MDRRTMWDRLAAAVGLAILISAGAQATTKGGEQESVAPAYVRAEVDRGAGSAPQAAYTYHNNTPVAVPDDSCTTGNTVATITVPDSFYVSDLNVGLCITHSFRADLQIQLRGPDGTTVTQVLWAQGGSADNVSVLFDDSAASVIDGTTAHSVAGCSASPPTYAYTFQPIQALTAFQGKAAAGTWTLEFCDSASADTGTINQWSLYFQSIDGVGLFPPSQNAARCPGEPVTYGLDLFNATAAPLTADLAYSSTFPASGPATVGPVAAGNPAPFSVEVTPFSAAQFPATDTVTVDATSGALTSSATATTTVELFDAFVDVASLTSGRGVRYHSLVYDNGKLYKIGGEDPTVRAYLDIYDIAGGSWTAGADMPAARTGTRAVAIGGKIYVAGGGSTTTTGSNTLYIYDPLLNSWSPGAALPAARMLYAGVTVGGKYYVIGGGTSSTTYLSTIYAYDPIANTWDTTLPNMSSARLGAMAGVIGGKIYVVGGRSASATFVSTMEIFDPATGTWSTGTSLPVALGVTGWVQAAEGVLNDRYLILAGGYLATATASNYYLVYDQVTNAWYLPGSLTHQVYGSAGVGVGGRFWFVSGRMYENDAFSYSLYATHSVPCAVPPTAGGNAYTTPFGVTLNVAAPGVLVNDSDPGALPLTAQQLSSPLHGTLTLAADGSFTYVPNVGYWGPDAFTYRATNGTRVSDPATVTLGVDAPLPALVGGTKTAAGTFAVNSTVTYTVALSNTGTGPQQDNAGDEFVDVLPATLALVSATATSGTAVATLGTNTVTWNGAIPAGGNVTITITATVNPGTIGQSISNQGTIHYDGDGNGSNEATAATDDPAVGGATDPTVIVVTGSVLEIPTLSGLGIAALALVLAGLALALLRRRTV